MDYWDTSALVKLYAPEPDSPQLAGFQQQPMYASAIADVEVLCILLRKERSQDIAPGSALRLYERFLSDRVTGRIVRVPYGHDVAVRAEEVVRAAFKRSRPIPIRSMDVIHIASALTIKAKRVVTTDSRLREVASLNSLAILP